MMEMSEWEKTSNSTPPYWLGISRKNVKHGWRNEGKKVENLQNWDQLQFNKFWVNQDHNHAIMGSVSNHQL